MFYFIVIIKYGLFRLAGYYVRFQTVSTYTQCFGLYVSSKVVESLI